MRRERIVKPSVAVIAVLGLAACGPRADDRAPSGTELYANHCASCHGEVGEGDGPVADVMRVTMPNLRTLAMRNGGTFPADGVRAYIDGRSVPAAHGDRYMPVWGDVFGWGGAGEPPDEALTQERLDALVEHVRELQYR